LESNGAEDASQSHLYFRVAGSVSSPAVAVGVIHTPEVLTGADIE
jgi:hypothetical protein